MRPIARWEMAVWYLFLVAWMQGMALFNLAWGMLLLAAVRHVREVQSVNCFSALRRYEWNCSGYIGSTHPDYWGGGLDFKSAVLWWALSSRRSIIAPIHFTYKSTRRKKNRFLKR